MPISAMDQELAQQHFRLLTENIDDLILFIDAQQRHEYVSPAVERLLGYTPEEAREMTYTDWLAPASAEQLMAYMATRRVDDRSQDHDPVQGRIELEFRHKGGRAVWGEVTLRPTRDDSGAIVGDVAIIHDITARRRAEDRIRASESRYRAIVEDQSELICRYDADGTLTFVNTAYSRYFGRRPEELVGKKFDWPTLPQEDGRDDADVEASSQTTPLATQEHLVRGPDQEERWLQWSNRAIADERGYLIEFQAVGRDITPRKLAERELRDRELLMRGCFDAVSDALFLLDTKGCVVEANRRAEQLYGYPRGELLGKPGFELIPPADQRIMRDAERALRTARTFTATSKNRRRDGSVFPAEVNAAVVTFRGAIHLLFAVRDISERVQAEEERARAARQQEHAERMEAIGKLAGGVAHGFNNLLMIIRGDASLMRAELPDEHHHASLLREIDEQTEIGAGLTAQLLGYARRGRYEVTSLSCCDLVDRALDAFERKRPELQLKREIVPDTPAVRVDARQIERALHNLLDNAVDASRDALLPIEVRVEAAQAAALERWFPGVREGTYALITLRDHGEGIDAALCPRVFEPFVTTRALGQGRGLGLAAVHGIIVSHGGQVALESTRGEGTTVRFALPAAAEIEQSPPRAPRDKEAMLTTVLVVDDEEGLRRVATRILERAGYRVLTAEDGAQAIELFQARGDEIGVVLLDLLMPGLDGLDTLRRLRAIDPTVKIVLTSGYCPEEEALSLAQSEGTTFLAKPFGLEALLEHIAAALAGG